MPSSQPPLTDLGRRTLGHLPVWTAHEAKHVKAEGGKRRVEFDEQAGREIEVGSIRSYGLQEFTERLAEDASTTVVDPQSGENRPMVAQEVEVTLDALVEHGWAETCRGHDGETHWRMTEAGFEALHAPVEPVGQVPGAVSLDLNPGRLQTAGVVQARGGRG